MQEHRLPELFDALLSSDRHIRETCRTPIGLARALGVLALDSLTQLLASGREIPTNEQILAGLLERMFERPYERRVFVHLYNLDLAEDRFVRIRWILVR